MFYPFTIIKTFWFDFQEEGAYINFALVNSAKSKLSISFEPNERTVIEMILREYIIVDTHHRDTFWERMTKLF